MRFPALARIKARLLLGLTLLCGVAGLSGYAYLATVTTRVSASMVSSQSSALDLGTASYAPSLSYAQSFADGTGANQFKIIYADSGTIAASDSVLIDLAGSATDAFGTTITCVTMKGIMVTAKAANVNDVLVGGARAAQIDFLGNGLGGAGDTNHLVPVGPGGVFLLTRPGTGTTITGGSRDVLRIKNSGAGTGVGYSLQVLCR